MLLMADIAPASDLHDFGGHAWIETILASLLKDWRSCACCNTGGDRQHAMEGGCKIWTPTEHFVSKASAGAH